MKDLLLLIAPKQKKHCVTKDRVPCGGWPKGRPSHCFAPPRRRSPLSLAALRASRQPLLRLADFCGAHDMRLQKPERCATHSSLFRPQDAVAVRAPAGGAKCQPVGKGQVGGKGKPRKTSPYHKLLAGERTCTCLPRGTAQPRRVLRTKQPRRSRGSGLLFASGFSPRSKNRAPQPWHGRRP